MADADLLLKEILALETSLHRPDIRRSRSEVERLLAAEFLEFGRSGKVYDRQTVIEALVAEASDPIDPLPRVADAAIAVMAADCVLLTYRSSRTSAGSSIDTLRSSIWKRVDGRWQIMFHQGTPA